MGRYLDIIKRMEEQNTPGSAQAAGGVAPPTNNEKYESTKTLSEHELRIETLRQVEERRHLTLDLCRSLAEQLDWPRLDLRPYKVGYVGCGQLMWHRYLKQAPLAELTIRVLPELQRLMDQLVLPSVEATDGG